MSYKIEDVTADLAERASARPPFGPGFALEQIRDAIRMEIVGSGINDPGPDWTEWTLYDASGNALARRRLDGY